MPIYNPPYSDARVAINDHEQAADPHSQYVTGDEANSAIGTALTAHIQAANPHPQYAQSASLIRQIVATYDNTVITGSMTIPFDETMPTNTEGNEFLTVTITPQAPANYLVVKVHAWLSEVFNAGDFITGAIFRDSSLEPIEGGCGAIAGTQDISSLLASGLLVIETRILAGSTAETTFKFRAGCNGGSCALNYSDGAPKFGGKLQSFIQVQEIAS